MISGARLPVFAGALVTALVTGACEGSGGPLGPSVELVDPEGFNAAAGVVEGELRVEVVQDGSLVDCGDGGCMTPIDNESFQLTLPIRTLEALTVIQARIDETPDGPIVGATPPFEPHGEGFEQLPVRLVMAPPSTCEHLGLPGVRSDGRPRLVRPRRDFGVAVRRNVVVLLGGVEADAASDRVGRFDQGVVETIPALSSFEEPAGPARGLALSEDDSVFVADGGAWRFFPAETSEETEPIPREPIAVHARASGASAVVRLDYGGAIVGGTDTRGVTWLDERGMSDGASVLSVPRSHPAAVALGDGVLVVGGAADGEPAAEWIEPGEDGAPLALDELPEGARGGWLVPSDSGDSALWIGLTAPDGTPSGDTFLISGCPDECVVERGTWPRPRAEAAGVLTAAGDFWIAGGRLAEPSDGVEIVKWIDVVRWSGEEPRIEEGPELAIGRAGAAAFEHASGVVTVAGGEGEGDMGLLDDFEHCTPDRLDPL